MQQRLEYCMNRQTP